MKSFNPFKYFEESAIDFILEFMEYTLYIFNVPVLKFTLGLLVTYLTFIALEYTIKLIVKYVTRLL